jgi:hypothetical protein
MRGILFSWLLLTIAACGGSPEEGDPCDVSGDLDECEEGAICSNDGGDGNVCRFLCDDHSDCESDERCNGVEGSNRKSCQKGDGGGSGAGKPI